MGETETGRWGEELAARHLVGRGWRILDRNYRAGPRELDLVAHRGDVLAFVEVKTRRGTGFGHPLEAITRRKRAEVETCARAWLRAHLTSSHLVRRFDAIAVFLGEDGSFLVEHVENAWRVGE